jgi:uncharacterized protein (DUF2267 family)
MAQLRFIDKVAERAHVPEDQAVALTEATLRTLAARLNGARPATWPSGYRSNCARY